MGQGATVALIDGEHHPSVVRDALDRLERERGLTAVLFCGGEEKAGRAVLDRAADHYGRPVELGDPAEGLRSLAAQFGAGTVVDLADEPVLGPERKLQLAALALHLGLSYEAPGMRLDPPPYAEIPFDGPKLGVIATGKRTGKTAVAGHWARLLKEDGGRPVIVSMGRGGPPEPQLAPAGTGLGSSGRGVTRRRITWRTPSSPVSTRSGAGGSAAAWPASRTSRTSPTARRSPLRKTQRRWCSRGRAPASLRSLSTGPCASSETPTPRSATLAPTG